MWKIDNGLAACHLYRSVVKQYYPSEIVHGSTTAFTIGSLFAKNKEKHRSSSAIFLWGKIDSRFVFLIDRTYMQNGRSQAGQNCVFSRSKKEGNRKHTAAEASSGVREDVKNHHAQLSFSTHEKGLENWPVDGGNSHSLPFQLAQLRSVSLSHVILSIARQPV